MDDEDENISPEELEEEILNDLGVDDEKKPLPQEVQAFLDKHIPSLESLEHDLFHDIKQSHGKEYYNHALDYLGSESMLFSLVERRRLDIDFIENNYVPHLIANILCMVHDSKKIDWIDCLRNEVKDLCVGVFIQHKTITKNDLLKYLIEENIQREIWTKEEIGYHYVNNTEDVIDGDFEYTAYDGKVLEQKIVNALVRLIEEVFSEDGLRYINDYMDTNHILYETQEDLMIIHKLTKEDLVSMKLRGEFVPTNET